MDNISHMKRREYLKDIIGEWNASRLDMFAISGPDENLEFHGVMRFLFQDEGSKLATKCIRVSSQDNTNAVIETLIEKFRPDMKMLTTPIYHLYEVDSNGVERKLDPNEYPLEVQLNWTRDEKEGKFVLRNAAHKPINVNKADKNAESSFKRKLSKREKKEQKKKEKDKQSAAAGDESDKDDDEPSGVFVRTKSNSEAVMRRRREMKVQKKLDEIQKEGDHGGLLKIHGDSLNPDIPYKSLLLSVSDTAAFVVKEMLDKYGLTKANPKEYCLVQKFNAQAGEIGGGLRPQEDVLDDEECPLAILQLQVNRGNITFHVRRRDGKRTSPDEGSMIPFLLELNLDGSDIMKPKRHNLHDNMTEVGSIAQPSSGQHLRMIGPTILPHHAVIANIEGVVTVTPTSPAAECYVEGKRIFETTVLQHGKVVRFGHHHAFRFIDPKIDERTKLQSAGLQQGPPSIENGPPGYSPRLDDVLPAGLEFRDEGEDNFLHSVISDITEGMCQFKLAPCYSLYLAARYRVDRVKPGNSMDEHYLKLTAFTNKVAFMIRDSVNRYRNSPQELAFWMANMSELLHFFKMDRDLMKHCVQAQEILADTVQDTFKDLVYIIQGDLFQSMPAFLTDSDNDSEAERVAIEQGRPSIGEVLHVLSSAMSLLRRCRVNAALTIQLFSQLFHYVNMWLFNKLVTEPHLGYINRTWGIRLKRRLTRVEAWAEKQGLELAADCHLCRITQAVNLLQAPKHSPDDIAAISSNCFKLNSLQLRVLLEKYQPELGELPQVPQDVIESVVSVARNTADDLTRSEGRGVMLPEDEDLQLPFLLPEDGYSCDIIKGIPQGLADFLEPVIGDSLCRLTPLPSQSGSWQVFMGELEEFSQDGDDMLPPDVGAALGGPGGPGGPGIRPAGEPMEPLSVSHDPEIISIQLHKVHGSMGLSIVAAKGESQPERGIYVKSVVTNGAADRDGRLDPGDQLLEVDGKSLVGLSQERAADLMKETGQVVNLKVAKQGAIYHGLATLLNQPTPPMSRSGPTPAQDNPSYMSQSKSTPMLSAAGPDSYKPPATYMQAPAGDDMRSKSQGNLLREDERNRWPQQPPQQQGPPGGRQIDNRANSQPNLDRSESPNYQNYPEGLRPRSQYRDGPEGPPTPSTPNQPPTRPRSEFVDPNWYAPPPNDINRQPIYQNQMFGKPRFENRDLPPPPPEEARVPPISSHPDDERLPPPPPNDYVNYQTNGSRSFANDPNQHRLARNEPSVPVTSQGYDNRQPPSEVRAEPPRGVNEPPPWARGPTGKPQQPPMQRGPGGPPSPQSPSLSMGPPPQVMKPGQGPRGPQPGDVMRAPPQIQPYRPPQPPAQVNNTYRSPEPMRAGPPQQPGDTMRGPGPQSVRPQMPYNMAPQGYPGPNQQIRSIRPPAPSANPWQKDDDAKRMAEDRRMQRENTIRDLESKPYRSPDEEDRLRRLKLDVEFERRAEQARREDGSRDSDEEDRNSLARSMSSNMSGPGRFPAAPQQAGRWGVPPPSQTLPAATNNHPDVPAAIKRDVMPAKTVTFKPAYRGDENKRPAAEYSKPTMRPAVQQQQQPDNTDNRIPPMNSQQDLLRHQRFQPSYHTLPRLVPRIHVQYVGDSTYNSSQQPPYLHPSMHHHQYSNLQDTSTSSYALSTPEREVLRTRLEEELREKQKRDSQDGRRNFHQQEEEDMRRRREHDLNQRKESDRIQMQYTNDQQHRYMDHQQPPPPQHQRPGGPQAQRDFPQQERPSYMNNKYNSSGVSYDQEPQRQSYNNRFSSPQQYQPPNHLPPASPKDNYQQQPYQSNQPSSGYPPPISSSQPNSYQTYNSSSSMPSNSNISRASMHGPTTPTTDMYEPTGNTPGVIGAQEVYRDPRGRIEAQQRAQKAKTDNTDRLSFRDKMKMFASEAGEGTPVQKPKASRSQRALEESLAYGNGFGYHGN